jgi:hypothetical protein
MCTLYTLHYNVYNIIQVMPPTVDLIFPILGCHFAWIDFSSSRLRTSSLSRLQDKDLLQIDATVIAGVLVLRLEEGSQNAVGLGLDRYPMIGLFGQDRPTIPIFFVESKYII